MLHHALSLHLFKHFKSLSPLTVATTVYSYSTNDAAATMREQIAERATEIEELRKLNNNLQESRSSLEHKYEQLKLEHQKMREDNTYQVVIVCT